MSKPNISIGVCNRDKSGLDVRNVYISNTCLAVICGDKIDATINSIQNATHDVPVLGEGWSELFSLTMTTVQTP